MITEMIFWYGAYLIAVAAYVFKNELTKEDKIFRWWDNLFYVSLTEIHISAVNDLIGQRDMLRSFKIDDDFPVGFDKDLWQNTPSLTIDYINEVIEVHKQNAFENRRVLSVPKWIYYPLGGCDKCLGGQLALWSAVYYGYSTGLNLSLGAAWDLVAFISLAIFMVIVINRLLPQECEV